MNEVTEEQKGLVQRLSRVGDFIKLISNEETEWRAIVEMQNTLDGTNCSQYIAEIDRRGYNLGNAPIEIRVEAFISVRVKR